MQTISGSWTEWSIVTVEIEGKQYSRKVWYKKEWGLYVKVNNNIYFEYELNT